MVSFLLIKEAIFLGCVQGFTEFLPVSSSGHLVIAQHFLPAIASQPVSLDIVLHLGTLLALILYFRKEWKKILSSPRIILMIAIASIITVLLVLPFRSQVENSFSNPRLASVMLMLTGVLLFSASGIQYNKKEMVHKKQAIIIGVFQALSVLPGISRSGATISAGIFSGLKSKTAVYFSFLTAIPVIFGAAALEASKGIEVIPSHLLLPYGVGFLVSLITGLLAIKWLMQIVSNNQKNLRYFAFYCLLLGLITVVFI